MDRVKLFFKRIGMAVAIGYNFYMDLPTPDKATLGAFILALCALSFAGGAILL